MPPTVTVPAGDTTAAFPIATTPTATTTVATITAVHGEVTKTADLTVESQTPPAPLELQSLTLSRASVVGGRSATGRVTLTGAAPAGGVEVQLSSEGSSASVPASVTVLEGRSSATFPISTTVVSASATATIAAAYAGVVKTAQLRVTPRFEITNIQNGDVLSGFVRMNVAVYDKTIKGTELTFSIDGTFYDWCKPAFDPSTNSLMSVLIETHGLANGSHALSVSDNSGNSDSRTVTFQNAISQLNFAALFDVSPGVTDVPPTCQIIATVESGANWTVTVKDDSNNPVKTFSGSGTSINITWDGTSDAGVMQPEGNYQLFFSTATTGLMSTHSKRRSRRKAVLGRPTKSRGGMRLNAAADGSGSSSFDYPLGVTNKHKFSDSLVAIDTTMFGTLGDAVNYAKFIRAQISSKIFQTFAYPCYPIIVGPKSSPALIKRIENEFELPKKLIYIMCHGDLSPAPCFPLGGHGWHSTSNPQTVTEPKKHHDVSALVAPLGYGVDMDPPKLVWMDQCNSGGGSFFNSAEPSSGGMDISWATCFGIEPGYEFEGVLLGVSGFSVAPDALDGNWTVWRREMWNLLMFEGRNFQTSYNLADNRTPRDKPGNWNPHARYRWYGTGITAF